MPPLPMISRYSDLFVTAFSSLINCRRREECFENRERRKRELNQGFGVPVETSRDGSSGKETVPFSSLQTGVTNAK